ncbi:twinkle homolog protein, chloroplastic/mitochondrial-like isoform X1 [Zingiber officinale]|uniref:twinkle homolog protein, chloroplastic/mitochondrial-like isoform X1 n=1 Tax=Zingiber officinale TaxID=94328 RepID=UPI001C4BCB55|nr:twinkle homolog protein, chloroplastic/mitochondrial-like isoform X1 [Zingiber officinale]
MPPVGCRPFQALLMSGSKYLPLRCFVAAAPAPLLLHRLLHLPTRTSAYFNYRLRSKHSRHLFCSRQPRRDMAADCAVEVAVLQDDFLTKRLQDLQSKLEAIGIMCNDWKLGVGFSMPCPKCKGRHPMDKNLFFCIQNTGKFATWKCLGSDCGWAGKIEATGEFMESYPLQKQATGEFMEQYAIRKQATGEDMGHYSKIKQATGEVMEHYAKRKQATGEDMEHYSKIKQATGEVMEHYAKIKQASKSEDCKIIAESQLNLEPLSGEFIKFFEERRISEETLRRNGVLQNCTKTAIAFPYRRDGEIISCKYRSVPKKFWQEKDKERILYGLDDIKNASEIIIVEGEIDKLSMEEAGYCNCVSVPDGAPPSVSENIPTEEKDTKFQFLWNCKAYLEKASRIILATDADAPGQALAEELARRLGRERCLRVKWPKKDATEVCKDANEVLMNLGPDALQKVIENAEFYPIRGLFQFGNFFHEIDAYYHQHLGYELGVSTGWRAVDEYYKVVPGELTVITGVPNSGKSEWIDALICNINKSDEWKFVLCSMENKVREHARKLLEKHIKKPFLNARYCGSAERMSIAEFEKGKEWLFDAFCLIRCEVDSLPSIQWVLERAKGAVHRSGVRGLVIDPYNELDHQRDSSQSETEYVSKMLTKIKRFAQHHSCHVWFVAHPRQLQNWKGGPPNLYDISGSAHFINKCDNGIVIHRNRDEKAGPLDAVQVCVLKVRNKVIGKIGQAFLSYDRTTGEYKDLD